MINKILFGKEVKSNYKVLIIILAVLTLYCIMVTAMFDPKLGETLDAMAESMPEIFAAVGMLHSGGTMIEFLTNYLYGFLLIVLPLVFIILLAGRLVIRYVDRGSMACLLATPNKRSRIIRTQALTMILGIAILVIYAALLCILSSQAMFPGELDTGRFLELNLGLFGLLLFFGGICFCSACVCGDSRFAYGFGAGLPILFILLQMLSQVGDKFEALKYATPLTLFDAFGIIEGRGSAVLGVVILYASGLLLFEIGIRVFCRKDLAV